MKKSPLAIFRLPSLISSLAVIHTAAPAATLVDLSATTLPLGPVTSWPNAGTAGGAFTATGTPSVVTVGGYKAVNIPGGAHYFTGPEAPAAITGENKPVTVEVWSYNPNIPGEETLLAWGRRGGPDGTNASYNYGTDRRWGAVGHWGGPDIGWIDQDGTDGAPAANAWHYLTWTYDGTTERLYADGVPMHFEDKSLNIWGVDNTVPPRPLPFRLGAQNEANGNVAQFNDGINILRVRVQDTVMTEAQIASKYASEKAALDLTKAASVTAFTASKISYTAGESITLSYELANATSASIDNGVGALSPLTSGSVVVKPVGQVTYTLTAVNANGTGTSSVTLIPAAIPNTIQVNLDATTLPLGPITAWPNTGTMGGTFTASGTPQVVNLGGYRTVSLANGTQYFTGPPAPELFTGENKPVTVEIWAYNPTIDDEETLFAWGRRGGPDGTNVSCNYGANQSYGAMGHWGGPDMGWSDKDGAPAVPAAKAWHYLVWTYDGITESLFADGVALLTEDKSLNIFATDNGGKLLPFRLGAQNNADGNVAQFNGGLSIMRLRVQDTVLTPAQIAAKYTSEKAALDLNKAASVNSFTASSLSFQPGEAITLSYSLSDATSASIDNGVGALSPLTNGTVIVRPTAQTTYTLSATNARGTETAVITLAPVAVLVNLDASALPFGPITAWPNTGTLGGTFTASGTPQVTTVGGYKTVNLADNSQFFTGPAAPVSLTGVNKPVSVEVWAYNPTIAGEETLVSWGRRGGPDATNASYNYGTDRRWGAVGHWGGPDIGWIDQDVTDGAPEADAWHLLTWTYDGTTERLYADGVAMHFEEKSLNVWGVDNTAAARPLPFRLGAQNEANGDAALFHDGLSILRVRIQNAVLTPAQIASRYTAEKAALDATVQTAKTLVNLDATTLPLGAVTAWPNTGTVGGTFTASGTPQVANVGGYRAVTLAGGPDYFTGPAAPSAITGINKPVTVEVWAYNPNIPGEETLLAWGRRGGPDGTNASYNYGSDSRWGAVGHWGGQDIGWIDQDVTVGAPAAGAWHYLTWTYNGATERLYADGVPMHFENKNLNVWGVDNTAAALPLPFRLGAQNNDNGTVAQFNDGISIMRVRVQDTAMTPEQISAKYVSEKAALDATATPSVTTFTANRTQFLPGETVTLTYALTSATSATINNGVGSLTPVAAGSVVVSPVAQTTYTLSATNANGTSTASITVRPYTRPAPVHRWSFNETGASTTVIDSVGGANGTILGTRGTVTSGNGNWDRSATQVLLAGGASATSAYIDLPNGLLTGQTSLTIEGWMTLDGTQNWGRVFDFGTGTQGEINAPGGAFDGSNYFVLTSQVGGDRNLKRLELLPGGGTLDISDPAVPGEEFHFAVVYDAVGNGGQPRLSYYKNGVLKGSLNSALQLSAITNVNNWLGRSNWSGDNNTEGSYNEFRMWSGPLRPEDVATSFTSGPNTVPFAGTPASPDFRITDAVVVTTTGGVPSLVALTWTTTPGRTYRVEQSADLIAWVTARNAAGADLVITATAASTAASAKLPGGVRYFLRIKDISP